MSGAVFRCLLLACLSLLLVRGARAWDPDQLEVFDVVEEINQNFYTLLNISQDANLTDIKKAFRALSRVLHPDKSDAPDADVQFRNLVSVYDVLRDTNKREHYNEVLKNGLPNWRSAMYYYRHYRKMGLAEMIVILFVLITIGQYLVGWASYLEKKYTHEQVYAAKIKKQIKKMSKKGQNVDMSEIFDLPPPTIFDTLPVQIPKLLWAAVTGLPTAVRFARDLFKDQLKAQMNKVESEFEESEEESPREKTIRKRKPGFVLVERDDVDVLPRLEYKGAGRGDPESNGAPRVVSGGGLWTDDDLGELVQLVKRFPGGTSQRWEKIADQMNRSVPEVTYMAAKLKENCYRAPNQEETQVTDDLEQPKKQKTKGGKISDGETKNSEWSQLQQRSLENALAKYPKGPVDRWDKIAKCVPEKTKEECMLRYKYLVEMLKKKKEEIDNENQQ